MFRTWRAGRCARWRDRVEPRDYADTAAMLDSYTPAELIGFARRLDPGLGARDFADAGCQLDQIDDQACTRYGLTSHDITTLRERFATWPRTPEAARKQIQAGTSAGRHRPAHP